MTGLRQSELLGAGATSTGQSNASGSATPGSAANTPPTANPTSPPAAWSRSPTASSLRSTSGRPAPSTTATSTSSSPTPQTANPLDGGKVTKRFQAACRDAGVRPIRFHDLRHTFATQLAASGKVSLRTLQEFLGHADAKTTQIYADYAPSTHEVEMVNAAFAAELEEASDTAPD